MLWQVIGVAAVSYLVGSIPFGYLIGRAKGIDVRKVGSCNIGATNVTRTVGPWYGKLCFMLDLLKGALPVLAARWLFGADEFSGFLPLIAAAGAFMGHMFTIFLKFRGGKGISTAAGAILALEPLTFVLVMAVWGAVFLTTRYVSLASICAATVLPVAALIFKWSGCAPLPISYYTVLAFALAAAVAVYRHRGNIKRLREGTESRFERHKKEEEPVK